MASPLEMLMSLLQAPKPRQPVQMRPLEQILAGAQISPQRSQYERTMTPGETRSPQDLQDMLGEVILAAGAGASPIAGLRGVELARTAARVRPGGEAAFNKWFEGSKAVDPSGKPMDLYHGTGSEREITNFIPGKAFLTTNRDRANSYAQTTRAALTTNELDGAVYPVHASVKKPFMVRAEGEVDTWRSPQRMAQLRAEGYDAIMTPPNRWTGEQIVLPIVSGSQIKAAQGNRGTYNRSSEDIRE